MRAVLVGAITIVVGCAGDPRSVQIVTTSIEPSVAVATVPTIEPSLASARDDAHRVMSARCGECHESHRATAVPRALAIFDLDHPDWPTRFDDHRFAAGLLRFASAPEPDRRAFVAFRDAELAARAP